MHARSTAPAVNPASRPALAGVGRALPPNRYDQHTLSAGLQALWGGEGVERRVRRLHRAVAVEGRNLALPMAEYPGLTDFGRSNDAFITVGTELAVEALQGAAAAAGVALGELDALFFTTVTGIATPTIDARVINRLDLPRSIRRFPFFGLGCVGGAAGVARMHDYLRGAPTHAAALIAVELCSLTLQHGDPSVANLIASGLFGDGAACVIATGADWQPRTPPTTPRIERPRPRILATRSAFYPDTERVMGWDVGPAGFKVVLSAGVPAVVEQNIGPDVDRFLADEGLARGDIDRWICHPGGPKVISAVESALDLPPDALALTRASLARIGNLSSASVLHVLADHLADAPPTGEGRAMLMAMGPGFCAELVLLSW